MYLVEMLVMALVFESFCLSALSQQVQRPKEYRPNTCLNGSKHKSEPTAEDSSYKTCLTWKDAACCTAEFTQQLASANVSNIDGFHWNRCGQLSERCERFFIEIECFYRCSPNIAHWHGSFLSSINHLPLCSDYCDNWFEACASDVTCAANWITDWEYRNGNNYCRNDSTCRNYTEVYGNGEGICTILWGDSFVYHNQTSLSEDRVCLVPWTNQKENPNLAAINRIFGINSGSPSVMIASIFILIFCISALILQSQ